MRKLVSWREPIPFSGTLFPIGTPPGPQSLPVGVASWDCVGPVFVVDGQFSELFRTLTSAPSYLSSECPLAGRFAALFARKTFTPTIVAAVTKSIPPTRANFEAKPDPPITGYTSSNRPNCFSLSNRKLGLIECRLWHRPGVSTLFSYSPGFRWRFRNCIRVRMRCF